jgi:hypothetical protein
MDAVWYFWIPLAVLFTALFVVERIVQRRYKRLGMSVDDSKIWRAIRQTRRDVEAHNAVGGRGPGVEWMDHRRR